jgi:hypothetical protein
LDRLCLLPGIHGISELFVCKPLARLSNKQWLGGNYFPSSTP